MIEKVGAMVIYLSPYYPDFNPIEMWCSQLNFFCECSLPRPQR
ncbi:hypothetical protein [Microcoleus vaginatus]